MRSVPRGNSQYVCTPCLLRIGRRSATNSLKHLRQSPTFSTYGYLAKNHTSDASRSSHSLHSAHGSRIRRSLSISTNIHNGNIIAKGQSYGYATATEKADVPVELSEDQMKQLQAAYRLRKRLNIGLSQAISDQRVATADGIPIEAVLGTLTNDANLPEEARLLGTLGQVYAGRPYTDVQQDLAKAVMHRKPSQRKVSDTDTKQILAKLRLLDLQPNSTAEPPDQVQETDAAPIDSSVLPDGSGQQSTRPKAPRRRQSLVQALKKAGSTKQESVKKWKVISHPPFPAKSQAITINPNDLELTPIQLDKQIRVPELSFDLSRVLFNPGVYQLRDPRSRVYNFDPYLEQPMAISEFNFDALNPYVTSSEDQDLLSLARSFNKRYIGSSSSMSGALCQFHFLLSQWRGLNTDQMSKSFSDSRTDFTVITRSPAAIFLRYRDGVYAVDADKEFDTPNVLMSLGKSLEKLLTLEKEDLEKWRRTHTAADESFSDAQDEAFHYSTQGLFLLRSQLDAYDPRLPGSGIFDLKTRAVAGIRMNMTAHEEGMGYQIKDRFGTWESYEREYYDMMRSNFLKYSMQVRMGNMDGIFVAYHNIEQIFGFQYISIADMDYALHGQYDSTLGDQEFRLSINLLQTIFDKVTQQYPEQSLRFHFETREPSASEPKPFMHIFAEPMTNQEIDSVQKRQHDELVAFEKKVFKGQDRERQASVATSETEISPESTKDNSITENGAVESEAVSSSAPSESSGTPSPTSNPSASSTAADTAFLEALDEVVPVDLKPKGPRPLIGFRLEVQNRVNDKPVTRPDNLSSESQWSVAYNLEQLSEESARRHYNFCKNRRQSAMSMGKRQVTQFIQNIRDLSFEGAEYRQKQVEADSQRETVVLYKDHVKS